MLHAVGVAFLTSGVHECVGRSCVSYGGCVSYWAVTATVGWFHVDGRVITCALRRLSDV